MAIKAKPPKIVRCKLSLMLSKNKRPISDDIDGRSSAPQSTLVVDKVSEKEKIAN